MEETSFDWRESFESACGTLLEGTRTENFSTFRAEIKEKTDAHYHEKSEELFIILEGKGILRVKELGADEVREVELEEGKEVLISPMNIHQVEPDGKLVVETVNFPPWREEDLKKTDKELFNASP